jgi:hypothetical protein
VTKKPNDDAVSPAVTPSDHLEAVQPLDDTMPPQRHGGTGPASLGNTGPAPLDETGPFPGRPDPALGNPGDLGLSSADRAHRTSGAAASGSPASGSPDSGPPASGSPAYGRPASGPSASGPPASGPPAYGVPMSNLPRGAAGPSRHGAYPPGYAPHGPQGYAAGYSAGGAAGYSVGGAAGYSVGGAAGYSVGGAAGYSVGGAAGYSVGGAAAYETVPVSAGAPAQARPVPIGRGRGKLPKGLITAYFAGGVALLLVGVVAVVFLAVRAYGGNVSDDATVTISRGGTPSASPSTSKRVPSAPAAIDPSDPARARFGPQKLANGKPFVVNGENDSKFEVTVTAGKFRKSACDIYSVKPAEGGYLPVKLKVRVLEGEPTISEFDFKFEAPDGSWLPSVGGSGCEGRDYGGFLRHLSAGRSYTSSVVYDVPGKKGDIVFVYPIMDVVASWKVG